MQDTKSVSAIEINPLALTTKPRSGEEAGCQHKDRREYSRLVRPYPIILIGRFFYFLRRGGVSLLSTEAADFIATRARRFLHLKKSRRLSASSPVPDEVLGLQPGEFVEVKSESEILATLNSDGKLRGLAFLPDMRFYCGRPARVYKRVERIFFEESRTGRKTKNTVLLEGAHCQGTGLGCDRACFFFWREAWLRRVTVVADEDPRANLGD